MRSACCSGKCSLAGQGAGASNGWLLPTAVLREEWAYCGTFQRLLTIHADVVATLMAYSILCNRLHTLDERLCCWLLTVQDGVGGDSFALTTPFIAAMLGVRLSEVQVALGALEQAGVIQCTGKELIILNCP
jgi:CRP-like cAMP-binding protein